MGLMYPTDYGYAAGNRCVTGTNLISYDSSCKSKDWLYNSSNLQWLMSPRSNNSNYVWNVNASGNVVSGHNSVNTIGLVFPVFYLTSTTSITSGSGTQDDPYLVSR